jgi:hypothetical protein
MSTITKLSSIKISASDPMCNEIEFPKKERKMLTSSSEQIFARRDSWTPLPTRSQSLPNLFEASKPTLRISLSDSTLVRRKVKVLVASKLIQSPELVRRKVKVLPLPQRTRPRATSFVPTLSPCLEQTTPRMFFPEASQ